MGIVDEVVGEERKTKTHPGIGAHSILGLNVPLPGIQYILHRLNYILLTDYDNIYSISISPSSSSLPSTLSHSPPSSSFPPSDGEEAIPKALSFVISSLTCSSNG